MELERELQDALIDAFDADPAAVTVLPHAETHCHPLKQQHTQSPQLHAMAERAARAVAQPPMVSATSFRHHYPTLDPVASHETTLAPPPPLPRGIRYSPASGSVVAGAVRYPAFGDDNSASDACAVSPPLPQESKSVSEKQLHGLTTTHPSISNDHNGIDEDPAVQTTPNVKREGTQLVGCTEIPATIVSLEELKRQEQLVNAEFQERMQYVATALAGETPHQLEARRQRAVERREREERRLAALEARIELVIEREHQREERQEERRARYLERAHRSSLDPSPERTEEVQQELTDTSIGDLKP